MVKNDTVASSIRECMEEFEITQDQLADHIGVSRYSINQLANGRRRITADMAIRLGEAFGTDAEHWMNLQQRQDLEVARRKQRKRVRYLKSRERGAVVEK